MKATNYLQQLKKISFKRKFGWDLYSANDSIDIKTDPVCDQVRKTLSYNEMPHYINDIGGNFIALLDTMADDLYSDLHVCLSKEHHKTLSNTVLGFLPTGIVNAFCLGKDSDCNKLEGYVVGLNYGLIFCCELLSQSIILENLIGDLAKYRQSGKESFKSAMQIYFNPTLEQFKQKPKLNHTFLSPEEKGEINAYIGANSAIMLTFIALHEMGHIINGDVDSNNSVKKLNLLNSGVEYMRPEEEASKNWECEYEADKFALEALCSRSKNSKTAWINFASLHMFFIWSKYLELKISKSLSPYHPPPLQRTKNLYNIMTKTIGLPTESHLDWIDNITKTWMKD